MNKHIDIVKEIKVLALRNGITISKMIEKMNESGYKMGSRQNLSNKFKRGSLRFNEIQDILEFLGYKLEIIPLSKNNK